MHAHRFPRKLSRTFGAATVAALVSSFAAIGCSEKLASSLAEDPNAPVTETPAETPAATPEGDPTKNVPSVGDGTLGSPSNAPHHPGDMGTGENGVTDPTEVLATLARIGTPEVAARIKGCGKIPYRALGRILATRGVNLTVPAQGADPNSAAVLYAQGASALGAANYGSRVAEAAFASTASMAKQMDILVAAAAEILANWATASACQGIALVADNKLTKDGISCLIGKPARDEHVTLASDLVAKATDVQTGLRLAIAALLAASHTCE